MSYYGDDEDEAAQEAAAREEAKETADEVAKEAAHEAAKAALCNVYFRLLDDASISCFGRGRLCCILRPPWHRIPGLEC